MGLDIRYYEKVTLKKVGSNNSDETGDGEVFLWNYAQFVARSDGLVEGIYAVSGASEYFRAGSYGGYNDWREQLAKMAGTTLGDAWEGRYTGAFAELINFTDSEGFIGPKTSAKLARDFGDWAARAETFALTLPEDDRSWFRDKYNDWRDAFEHAAGEGAVWFH